MNNNPWDVVELIKREKGNSSMSLAEADKLLRTEGYYSHEWDYLKDHHFVKYIYLDIKTLEDVNLLLAKLDKDNEEHTKQGTFRSGCSKAKGIRLYLENDFWKENTERLRAAIAPNRRIICSCHETGSFKPRNKLSY